MLERRPGGTSTTYVLRVEQAYKGDLSDRVEVVTPTDGASCGISAAVGERLGLLLTRSGGEWRSSLCGQVEPAVFLESTDIDDSAVPPLNWGGIVVGALVLAIGAFLLLRRVRAR